ncbi:MAG TPA: HNH endonuclease [Pirellulales bacterium]|nr:HNH endonuclease [Pirellulales bacterium]
MRPVLRGDPPTDATGKAIVFSHYREARDFLIERIGDYCSYCEVCLHGSIHVEHVRPKKPNPDLKTVWTNFLLACDNCNSVKGDFDVVLSDYLWPDTDNTTLAFDYHVDEPPRVSQTLKAAHQQLAINTIQLTGLDRVPGHPDFSARDRRWQKRKEAWGVAILARKALAENPTDQLRESIVHNAVSRGFWSVWVAVFHDDNEMRRRLLKWFPGTAISECFDAGGVPKPRPGGQI